MVEQVVDQLFGRDRLTFGVEEEFLLVDAESRAVVPRADAVLADAEAVLGDQIAREFYLGQLETRSRPCSTAAELRRDLARCRRVAAHAAAGNGCLLVASPCAILTRHPLQARDEGRYGKVARHLHALLAAVEYEMSGCHVHIGSLGHGEALALSAGLRPWLPVLQALAANSPFAAGRETGSASARGAAYARWPTVGPAPVLDESGYDACVRGLIESNVILDAAMLYWYARPSEHYPTLEIRVVDVNGDLDTTVQCAVLLRALATDLLARAEQGQVAEAIDDDVLVENHRRAARDGLEAKLCDPATGVDQPVPALLDALMRRIEPALEALGDLPFAVKTLRRILREGNGAARQRAVYARTGSCTALIDHLARETDASRAVG